MSFGFSVGDFLAVGRIISDITSALHGSKAEYQELVRELENLNRALHHVDKLKGPPSQTVAIDQIKCAALNCRQPLEDFKRKMQKFEGSLGSGKSCGTLKDAAKKAHWAFGLGKREEVNRLRSYLDIHISVINMQLMQHGFEKVDIASEERSADNEMLKNSMEESTRQLRDVRGDVQAQALAVRESKSMIQILLGIIGGDIAAPLKALTGVVTQVCVSTQQIYNIALEIQANTRSIGTRFTYFQIPVQVEDFLGRIFPFPAEFSVSTLNTEIAARFKEGPGKSKVAAGDYEIFNAKNTHHLLNAEDDSILLPGMSLSMAVLLERNTNDEDRCPISHCKSTAIVDVPGGKTCSDCGVWFRSDSKKRKRDFSDEYLDRYFGRTLDTSSPDLAPDLATDSMEKKRKIEKHPTEGKGELDVFKRISFVRGVQAVTFEELSKLVRTSQHRRPYSDKDLSVLIQMLANQTRVSSGHGQNGTEAEEVELELVEEPADSQTGLDLSLKAYAFQEDIIGDQDPRSESPRGILLPYDAESLAVFKERLSRPPSKDRSLVPESDYPSESSRSSDVVIRKRSKPQASRGDAVMDFLRALYDPELAARAGEEPPPLSDDIEFEI